ncbi:MAG: SurA N-terminal domain-containing protein [Chromatiaceae bacterium]|nr:SurA N-terminal domain-containing protein [Chromatiaceae bacterium]
MLQAIREKAQGWIAWAIVILITIPFALWGIQEYLGVGGEPEVAVVSGDKITQRMLDERTRDFRENLRQSLGDNISPDFFDDARLKAQVLDAMIEEAVLGKSAQAWNLRTSDAQARALISSIPGFQRNGQFDQDVYDAAVRNRGMSRAGFEQRVRQDMSLTQLRSGVRDTAFVTSTDLGTRIRLRDQTRALSYVRIPAAAYLDQISVTQEELRSYYETNLDRYRTPERVKLSYLLLDAAKLRGKLDVGDDVLQQYFQDHRSEFVGREERAMRHILVAVSSGASDDDVAKAKQKADGLVEQIRGGADFAALAKDNSDDPGSAANGGDLGWVERGMMVPAFEEAGFVLPKDGVSDPVRTEFGFHIIQVTDIRGGSDAGFDDMRDQVEKAYRKYEAENLYYDYAERLAETAYENSASLTPAAEALGLQVQTTDWITRDGQLPGDLNVPRVINAAFSDDVLTEGHNSEVIEVAPQRSVVVRVAEHEPAGVKSLDENRLEIEQDFRRAKASETAAQQGAKLLVELQSGARTLAQLASDHAWQINAPGAVGRGQAGVPAEVLAKGFELAPPQEGKAAYAGVVSTDGDYLLIEVSSVQGGDIASLADAERPLVSEQATGQTATAQMRYFTQSLRDRATIEIKPLGE